MHRLPSPPRPLIPRWIRSSPAFRAAAFSLVEVTLAIAIVAFAFVALLGLLPVGLRVFRDSIDGSNEAWIMQAMNSMIQVTDFSKLEDLESGEEGGGDIYYFDEEGRLTDTDQKPSSDAEVKNRRVYAVKLIVDDLLQPSDNDKMSHARRVIAVLGTVNNPGSMKTFESTSTADHVAALPANASVRCRAFMVARMDAQTEATASTNP